MAVACMCGSGLSSATCDKCPREVYPQEREATVVEADDAAPTVTRVTRSRVKPRKASTTRSGNGITAAEVQERVDVAEGLMLENAADRTVATMLMTRFGCARRTALEYVLAVRQRWAEEAAPVEQKAKRQEYGARFAQLHDEARAAGNHRAAIAALERMAQLDGLLTSKVEHSGEVKHTLESPAERRARIAELQRKMADDRGGK